MLTACKFRHTRIQIDEDDDPACIQNRDETTVLRVTGKLTQEFQFMSNISLRQELYYILILTLSVIILIYKTNDVTCLYVSMVVYNFR